MNAVVKLLTKVLERRLNSVMNYTVSDSQSAFIKHRQMSDCILLTSEVFEALQAKRAMGLYSKLILRRLLIRCAGISSLVYLGILILIGNR